MFNLSKYKVFFFDFDGVILNSVNVKTIAFSKLFEKYGDDVQEKVVRYHVQNGGISRYEKFRYYYKHYLKQEINEAIIHGLDKQMNQITMEEIMKVDFIPGMPNFLQHYYRNKDCYIISATPQGEMRQIVKRKKLESYFIAVYGSPIKKYDHMQNILLERGYHPDKSVMFGDAATDEKAAEMNQVDFIGVNYPSRYNIPNFKYFS